jgi:hypothetical protein
MALSFYPLLFIFFIGVGFRFHIVSAIGLYGMILWLFFSPYIITFYGTVVAPEKKEDAQDKEGGA